MYMHMYILCVCVNCVIRLNIIFFCDSCLLSWHNSRGTIHVRVKTALCLSNYSITQSLFPQNIRNIMLHSANFKQLFPYIMSIMRYISKRTNATSDSSVCVIFLVGVPTFFNFRISAQQETEPENRNEKLLHTVTYWWLSSNH